MCYKQKCKVVSLNLAHHVYSLSPLHAESFVLRYSYFVAFYRAMHFSARRGIAIACRLSVRLSVCLSVCNVGGLWSHRLEYIRNNFTIS